MSTFLDCINSAVESGRITAVKAGEAAAAFTEAYDNGIAEGLTESVARDMAANRAVEQTMKLKGEKRWRRINELRRAHELYSRFSTTDNLTRELQHLGAEIEVAHRRVVGSAHSLMDKNMEAFRPKAAGLVHPVRDMDDIAYAAYGDTSNPTAKALADEIVNAHEYLRKSANMYGAAIPANPNRRLPQSHDRLKVGRVTEDEWVADHMERLDWDLMRYNDKPIPVAQRAEILGRVYGAIRTDGNSKVSPGHTTAEHLASRMAKERFLYYKNAKGYVEMQKKYGAGNTFQQSISMIDSMARDIATLEKLGPNPTAMKNYLANTVKKAAADKDLAKPVKRGKSETAKATEALAGFDREYDLHNLLVMNGEENVMAQAMATVRTTTLATVLSGAYIANLADIAFIKHNALMHKLPLMGHTRAYMKYFIPNKENRAQAIRAGLIAESATSIAMGYQRQFGLMDGARWARNYADFINRAGLLTPHIQAARWAQGMELMGAYFDNRHLSFDNIPFVQLMRDTGITEKDWDLFRSVQPYTEAGLNILRPLDLANSPNGNATQNQIVANKFLDFIQWDARNSIPSPSNRVRATLGQHIPANTVMGQMARTFGALKSFPATIMMMQGRDILDAPPGEKLLRAAQFFVFLTAAGAFTTQLRELANGRDPYDMTTGDFWLRAVVNGGSFGLLGDIAADSLNLYGEGNLAESIGGPLTEFYGKTIDLTYGNVVELLQGEDTKAGKEAAAYFRSYGPRLWQIRLLMDRMIHDTLMRQADPEAYRRLKRAEQRRLSEEGRGQWWAKDQAPRMPDWGTAVGQ